MKVVSPIVVVIALLAITVSGCANKDKDKKSKPPVFHAKVKVVVDSSKVAKSDLRHLVMVAEGNPSAKDLQKSADTIAKRLKALNFINAIVGVRAPNHIVVTFANAVDPTAWFQRIGQTGRFQIRHFEGAVKNGRYYRDVDHAPIRMEGERLIHGNPDRIPGAALGLEPGGTIDNNLGVFAIIRTDGQVVSQDDIKKVTAGVKNNLGSLQVKFLTGANNSFEALTKKVSAAGVKSHVDQNILITIDDEILSVMPIQSGRFPRGITNGQLNIFGLSSKDRASDIAGMIEFGPLPVLFGMK